MPAARQPVSNGGLRIHQLQSKLSQVSQAQIVLGVAILLMVILSLTMPRFATFGNMMSLLERVSVLGILSLGAAIVIIARSLDISQIGSMIISSGFAAVLVSAGWAPGWALLVGLIASTIVGLVNGYIIAFLEVPSLFVTIASNLVIFGISILFLATSGEFIYLPDDATVLLAMGGHIAGVPIAVIVFLGMALLVHLFLSRTRLGRLIYAHGDNPETSRQIGFPVRVMAMIEFVLSADIAFVAGLVLMGSLASVDLLTTTGPMIFNVILVTVLGGVSLVGGRGHVGCVLVGALLIGVIINGMTLLNLGNDTQNIVRGLVLLGAIVLDNRLHPRDEETARQGE